MRRWLTAVAAVVLAAGAAGAQGLGGEPVFSARLEADRAPLVAGEPYRLAVVLRVEEGWHVYAHEPGDEFAVPTTVAWRLPEGWPEPAVRFPTGREVRFAFAEGPIRVWEGTVLLVAEGTVPADASGTVTLAAEVTAQACNDRECLPPTTVTASLDAEVAPAGAAWAPRAEELFAAAASATPAAPAAVPPAAEPPGDLASRLAAAGLPLQLVLVFLAGLALNLTPCVYPLIPITVGFFAQQAKGRRGGTFSLALVYVLGMSVTYSALGVAAALTGRLFGSALQSPAVIALIVAVLVALAASMFGLWELRVPGWATRAAGGRGGHLGALVMGLLVGVVAAPCIGPFVLGLLTYVGELGEPVTGFVLFFTLAMGLGLPYLLLGTFTGAINRLPASGAWMLGVRKVFGVLLLALAVHFAGPLLPGTAAAWAMGTVLLLGGLFLLVVERTGWEQPAIDRAMRLVSAGLIVAGALHLPVAGRHAAAGEALAWRTYDERAVREVVASGQPVILDFFADWCAPCKELDEKTFADPRVREALASFARFKVDLTRSDEVTNAIRRRYEVRGVPTVIVYRDGAEAFRITGFEPPERFLARLR